MAMKHTGMADRGQVPERAGGPAGTPVEPNGVPEGAVSVQMRTADHEGAPRRGRPQLGEILVARGVITREQLAEALAAQRLNKKRLGENLRMMGITSDKIAEALSEQLGLPLVRLSRLTLDEAVLQAIPEQVARRHQAIPISLTDSRITVALVDPLDVLAVDDIRRRTGREVNVVITPADDFNVAINQYPALDESVEEAIRDVAVTAVEEAPIVRLVSLIISKAVRQRASDIHIEPQERHLRVRYRIDGLLVTVMTPPRHVQAAVVSRLKILANLNIAERRLPQDGRIQLRVDEKEVDIRVSTVPTVYGEKVVLRLLDRSNAMVVLDRLGLGADNRGRLEALVRRPHGIFLLTGPTGSGKTTTLYAILNSLNAPDRNILTIEDPVEYHIAGISQVAVNPRAGLTFAGGLRAFLRQDPDIIMVGEIRDGETAAIAVQAALTGHLVLSTLHTNDAPGAVTRLVDMGVEPFLVASTLLGAAAQRLVRVLCIECKERTALPPDVAARFGWRLDDRPAAVYTARGCPACGHTGYRGRTALFELMAMTEEMQELVVRRAPDHELRAAAARAGMRSLLEDGVQKVRDGVTSVEEILRVLDVSEGVRTAPAQEEAGDAH